MEALMIPIKPRWFIPIANKKKNKEVRKNVLLRKTIQKLIDKYGYALIYIYVSKDTQHAVSFDFGKSIGKGYVLLTKGAWKEVSFDKTHTDLNGKVAGCFKCYKCEDIIKIHDLGGTCLEAYKLAKYAKGKPCYSIHISNLEIFGRPKELEDFMPYCNRNCCIGCKKYGYGKECSSLTRPPQNFCYVEAEE